MDRQALDLVSRIPAKNARKLRAPLEIGHRVLGQWAPS